MFNRFVDERFTEIIKQPLPFENCEYELRISGTVSTDKRIMSFVNYLWGFEVTGGRDQYEKLTIIMVRSNDNEPSVKYVKVKFYLFRWKNTVWLI